MVTIIVRNLTSDVTKDDLQELFERYGVVEGIDLVAGQNFGYVRMRGASDAHQAIRSLKKETALGRSIEIEEARPFRYRSRINTAGPQLTRR